MKSAKILTASAQVIAGFMAIIIPVNTSFAAYNSMLAPTEYTPSTYIQPQYDVFDNDYQTASKPDGFDKNSDTPPSAQFIVIASNDGLQNSYQKIAYGTTDTQFRFDASGVSDEETDNSRLEVRWDFESDDQIDGYFSRNKIARHTYEKPGVYIAKLEVLDWGGNITTAQKTVVVVENTAPIAHFTFSPVTGTENSIFAFDTSSSYDDQYLKSYLEYRFDWDGDGSWDTKFNKKNIWYHRFGSAGTFKIIMEARDPGEKSSFTTAQITTKANTAPTAQFTIREIRAANGTTNGNGTFGGTYPTYTDFMGISNYRNTSETNSTHRQGDYVNLSPTTEGYTSSAEMPTTFTSSDQTVTNVSGETELVNGPTFVFDASATTDAESSTGKLLYRWDFHYNGVNDIIYDTSFGGSSTHSGTFKTPGTHTIRLEVMDEDGAVSYAYAQVEI